MIVFGTRSIQINSALAKSHTCAQCDDVDTTELHAHQTLFHVFWVLVFPMSKNVISHCTHCDLAIEQDRMPTALRRKADQLKMNSKGPLWRFAGFAILVGIGALGFLQIALDNAQDRGYIEEPMVGDVYVYEIDPRAYSTFKAVQVYPDSVDIVMNNYQVGSQYASRQIDKPGNYSDSIRRLARNDLADLYVTGEVVDIERNARIEVWDFIR